jgi:hypothetical protein
MDGLPKVLLTAALALVPLSMALTLAALLANGAARRRARREPERFLPPKPAGLAMALASFPLALGVFLLPGLALSGGGTRARDKAVVWNLAEGMEGLALAFTQARQEGLGAPERQAAMGTSLATLETRTNPWLRGQPAFRGTLLIHGSAPGEVRQRAAAEATTLGEVVFVFSEPGSERCLAGAVLTKGLTQPPPGDPELSTVPSADGPVVIRSVLLAD